MKFNENPSGGSRVFQCGRLDTQRDGRTDKEKKRNRNEEANNCFSQFCLPA